MTYRGKVHNGVIVIEGAPALPEGTEVKVETVPALPNASTESIFDIGKLAKDTGIPDLSVNIDHYLYGHPRRNGA
jgi:hypothetical protein